MRLTLHQHTSKIKLLIYLGDQIGLRLIFSHWVFICVAFGGTNEFGIIPEMNNHKPYWQAIELRQAVRDQKFLSVTIAAYF